MLTSEVYLIATRYLGEINRHKIEILLTEIQVVLMQNISYGVTIIYTI